MTTIAQAPGFTGLTGSNVTSGTANNFGTLTQIVASTSTAYYLIGVFLSDSTAAPNYINYELNTGAAGSETVLTLTTNLSVNGTLASANAFIAIPFPIAIPASTRISARAQTNLATQTIGCTLLVIAQSNLIDTAASTIATNLDATVSSRLATAGYTAPDNTTITAINAKTTNLPAAPAAVSDIPTATQNATQLLDQSNAIETAWTVRQTLRIISAAVAAILHGAPNGPIVIRNLPDTKDRITATVDSHGNRTSIIYDKT